MGMKLHYIGLSKYYPYIYNKVWGAGVVAMDSADLKLYTLSYSI